MHERQVSEQDWLVLFFPKRQPGRQSRFPISSCAFFYLVSVKVVNLNLFQAVLYCWCRFHCRCCSCCLPLWDLTRRWQAPCLVSCEWAFRSKHFLRPLTDVQRTWCNWTDCALVKCIGLLWESCSLEGNLSRVKKIHLSSLCILQLIFVCSVRFFSQCYSCYSQCKRVGVLVLLFHLRSGNLGS